MSFRLKSVFEKNSIRLLRVNRMIMSHCPSDRFRKSNGLTYELNKMWTAVIRLGKLHLRFDARFFTTCISNHAMRLTHIWIWMALRLSPKKYLSEKFCSNGKCNISKSCLFGASVKMLTAFRYLLPLSHIVSLALSNNHHVGRPIVVVKAHTPSFV